MNKFVYSLYLKSPGWRQTKQARKEKYCKQCGETNRLQLHHEAYRWHNEHTVIRWFTPNMSDPMNTLCDRCHRLATERMKREKSARNSGSGIPRLHRTG